MAYSSLRFKTPRCIMGWRGTCDTSDPGSAISGVAKGTESVLVTESDQRARQKSQIQHIAGIQESLDQVLQLVDEYVQGPGSHRAMTHDMSATVEAINGQIDELHALVLKLESYA